MLFVKSDKKQTQTALKEPVSGRIQSKYDRLKKQWAARMGSWYNRLSLKRKKMTLLCFVLLAGGYSIFLIVSAFKGKQSLTHSLTHISIPRHVNINKKNDRQEPAVLNKEYQRIHRFRLYMDSLHEDPMGRLLYDSIVRSHPGLMDSVYMIENRSQ